MKKVVSKACLMTALLLGGLTCVEGTVSAAGMQEFVLDPMVVTAQRTEKRDIDVPATTKVIDAQQIKDAGYKNVFDAIEHQVGLTSTGYGDAGQDYGFSSGRTVIRGYDRGTLVMVDGIPMNLKNYNSLSGIPIDMVQKIEIIKGAAGTLYGSEAMGGVINIITKRPAGEEKFKVKGTVGNYYKDWGMTYANEKLILSVGKEYSDNISHSNDYPAGSDTDWWVGKGQTDRAALAAQLSDKLGFNIMYENGDITRGGTKYKKNGDISKKYDYVYDNEKVITGLHYDDAEHGLKGVIGYNYRQVDGFDFVADKPVSSSADLSSYIADVQKKWELGDNTLIAGYSFKREDYENKVNDANKAHRSSSSLYLSYENVFNDKFSATLGLRGEFINDPYDDQNIVNPQFQTLYKIDGDTSWFVNIGKAFQMPTVDAYFGKKGAHRELDPEEGWTYETGFKKVFENKSIKLSIYHMDFDNKLGWSDKDKDTGEQYAINKGEFKNTGVEVEYSQIVDDNWSYSLALGYGNPEIKDPTKNVGWVQDAGKLDGAASVTYAADKLRSTLSFKYLGDREEYKGRTIPVRSRLTWNTSYDLTKNDNLTLTLNNLLDHDNYSNKYGNLDLPFNWRLMYTRSF